MNQITSKYLELPINRFDYPSGIIIPELEKPRKEIESLTIEDNYYEDFFGCIKKNIPKLSIDSIFNEREYSFDLLNGLKLKIKKVSVLGEYFSSKRNIHYYNVPVEYKEIVKIHERFHAIHHLTIDSNTGLVWKNFTSVDSFYKELLAQLFTYLYIRDIEKGLLQNFLSLCKMQDLKYNSWRIFENFTQNEAEDLYWEIRNRLSQKKPLGLLEYLKDFINQNSLINLEQEIDSVVSQELTYICKNPLVFVSETDIHALIFRRLLEIKEIEKTYPTNCSIGLNNFKKPSVKKYETYLIHKEYGHKSSAYSRSDIVILDKEDICTIDDPINLKSNRHWLKPNYIFEFGTEKCASSKIVFRKHLVNDLKKLSKSNIKGYLIHIHRIFCRKRVKANRKKYNIDYQQVVNNVLPNHLNKNIRILIILVDIGNEGRKVKSKIRIYKNNKFENINLRNLQSEVLNILK